MKHQLNLKWGRALVVGGLAAIAVLSSVIVSPAQTTIAKWTFETLPSNFSYAPGAGVSTTNFYADAGTQAGIAAISGMHSGFGTTTYSSPAGNGSPRSLSSNGWTNNPGDYYQVVVNTTGFTNISLSMAQLGSGTGPRDFRIAYSVDGVTFTPFATNLIGSSSTWTANSFDLSSITALANASTVYFRFIDLTTNSVGGGIVGTGGTSRIDDITVAGTIAGPPQIIVQPANTTNFFGDTVSLTVISGGDAPLFYQWYTNSTTTPLVDGPSGFGSGTISGSTSNQLTLSFVNTNQAGNYFVIVSNALNWVTSSVVHLTVNVRPPIVANIAYLHTLHNTNYVLTDTTNIYVVEGIVTTIGNLVSGTTEVESFYLQDATGGMNCFFRGGFPFPATGDRVRITAPLLQFNGLLEAAPVNGNPAHSIEILDSGNPLPAPQIFDFTTLPTPQVMEENIEGRYLVVSNVFLGTTNNATPLQGGQTIYMTNSTGQIFRMTMANNVALGPVGYPLAGTYATAVRGVMTQSQTSGTVLTNFYSMVFSDNSQIDFATPPIVPIPLSFVASGGSLTLNWNDSSFTLQFSTNVAGPYVDVSGATSPFTTNAVLSTVPAQFFRLYHP